MIIGYFLTEKLNWLSFDSSVQLSKTTFEQMAVNFITKLSEADNIIESIVNDSKIIEYINTQYQDDFQSYNDYVNEIEPFISRLKSSDKNVDIKIYTKNATIGFSGVTGNLITDMANEDWFKQTYKPQSTVIWTKKQGLPGVDNYIGCYKVMYNNFRTNDIAAVISVFTNEEQLFSMISNEKEAGKVIFLIDNSGCILTSTERDMIFKSSNSILFNRNLGVGNVQNSSIVKYINKNYLIFNKVVDSPENGIKGWRLLYLLPEDKIIGGINQIWFFSVLLCLLCIVFSFLIVVFLSDNITKRLANLVDKINRIWRGDFTVPQVITGTDEIGLLETDFFRMAKKIDSLINEVYETSLMMKDTEIKYQKMQMSKKDAELIALYGQINPHYFFNTLETIRMNLIQKNDRDTANIVKIFSESFRGYLDNNGDFHKLQKELELVNKYFLIQKYRFGNKLDMTIDITEDLESVNIPKLIIQPLVENAITHGLESKIGKGLVILLIFMNDSNLNIIVSDDGIGMTKEALDALKASFLNKDTLILNRRSNGLALKNIHDRLTLLYGDRFSFEISSEEGAGTKVEVSIPLDNPAKL